MEEEECDGGTRVLYSGKFANFHTFHMKPQDTKIKTVKILQLEITTTSKWAILTRGSSNEAMAFYQHFQPLDNFPDPSGL